MNRKPDFELYDRVADAYERFAAPHYFEAPAGDLVSHLGLRPGERVLDAGAGTCVVASRAVAALDGDGCVFALDLSSEMLSRSRADVLCVVGRMPGIPLADASFDAVASSFALSHIEDYGAALRDMVRVLKPRGRIAVSAWADECNEYDALWGQVARDFVAADALEQAVQTSRPHQAWLSDPDNLQAALRDAGAGDLVLHRHGYEVDLPVTDFLVIKSVLLSGRFVRSVLSVAEWSRFNDDVETAFAPLGERLRFTHHAHIAVGKKAFAGTP